MESRKRKAIASVLDGRHLHRLPKVRDRLSSLVRTESRTTSLNLDYEQQQPQAQQQADASSENKRWNRLEFKEEDVGGGTGLDIDLRSLEAFHNADESWFGHEQKKKVDAKTTTPIADLFSNKNGSGSRPASLVVDKPLPAPPPATSYAAPNGQGAQHRIIPTRSGDAAVIEIPSESDFERSGSVLERRRGVRPRASRERVDPSVEPVRIKLATTSAPAEPNNSALQQPTECKKPPPLEPTWRAHVRQKSQKACQYENAATSANAIKTATTPKSPGLSGVSVKTHIRRRSQHQYQIPDGLGSPTKRQSMPVPILGKSSDRPALAEIKKSLQSVSQTPASPADTLLPTPSTSGKPPQNRRQSWSTASASKISVPSPSGSSHTSGLGIRRNASTRTSGGVNRLAWIKELEERKDTSPGLSRELPVLRKVQGSVANKLAKFESIGQQPEVTVQPGPRTRSNSIVSQKSFLTGTGSRPGSWYQGSTIATTARTSTDSYRPQSVLQNYDESFREKMQALAGMYEKKVSVQESEAGGVVEEAKPYEYPPLPPSP